MAANASTEAGVIRVGIGGWTYAPWRGTFYPPKLTQARELEFASSRLTAIEINSTYHGTQKRASFIKWKEQTPDDFVFSVKASRFATNRRVLAEAGESVERFLDSGITELGPKLGPIVWQFAPSKAFEPGDFEAFLGLLPPQADGIPLRHVLEVRHASFACAQFLALARQYKAATVFTDAEKFPSFADVTGDFVYARLMRSNAKLKYGYAPKALDAWAQHAQAWARGEAPEDLPRVENNDVPAGRRDVFVFFINGDKERAPAAATALLSRLDPDYEARVRVSGRNTASTPSSGK
ncbi:DUF72 domain-containing protein [Cupriavidus gilardii]|uniref:DUF72 domain-containing protein n=1 Tax=Cupriavidus gilardii TaxID=82541 RepID=UPI0006B2DECF|nr:DUF72 domain-containing protein [Cupriavidus gilardii]MCT9013886.1 DUF72 domain-containing protein [Cupriavidus gilardii]MCT9052074.1 DUF72 domain-containing protein [Cupriavidus gilardii]WNG70419.1 DUF72 domain-containing protein [Cupriavidus gilardii]